MKAYRKQSILLLTLALTSSTNSQAVGFSNSESQGKSSAKIRNAEVHLAYLNCYALNEAAKNQCLAQASSKYISKAKQQDKEYVQAFQFESEKLGFKQFLNNLKLPCDIVEGEPIFDESKKAFIVSCMPEGQYMMQFNSETKKWRLLE